MSAGNSNCPSAGKNPFLINDYMCKMFPKVYPDFQPKYFYIVNVFKHQDQQDRERLSVEAKTYHLLLLLIQKKALCQPTQRNNYVNKSHKYPSIIYNLSEKSTLNRHLQIIITPVEIHQKQKEIKGSISSAKN